MLVVGLIPICAVAKQSRPTTKNGCLRVLCRLFCLQPRYYGLPSLLKFDGPTSPGANCEKYDFSKKPKSPKPTRVVGLLAYCVHDKNSRWLDNTKFILISLLKISQNLISMSKYANLAKYRTKTEFALHGTFGSWLDGSSHKAKQNHLKSVIPLFWLKFSL